VLLLLFAVCLERILPSDRQELLKNPYAVPPETVFMAAIFNKKNLTLIKLG